MGKKKRWSKKERVPYNLSEKKQQESNEKRSEAKRNPREESKEMYGPRFRVKKKQQ